LFLRKGPRGSGHEGGGKVPVWAGTERGRKKSSGIEKAENWGLKYRTKANRR